MSRLADAIIINETKVKNRAVLPPMSLLGANEDGTATEKMAQGYENFARGGFGMIITEGLYMDDAYSKGAPKQPGLITKEQMESWKPIVQKVHEQEVAMIAQLAHIGAFGRGANGTVAPSSIQISDQLPVPKELSKEEIWEIVKDFGIAAKTAQTVGFDGIEIHGAMGLVQQFLSAITNHRTDEYGGTIENRMRFLTEIIQEIRNNTAPDFIIGVRVLEDETLTLDETTSLYGQLGKQEIDYIHTSEKDARKIAVVSETETFSALVHRCSGKVTIAAGGIGTRENALNVLESADMISVGKAALVNANWAVENM